MFRERVAVDPVVFNCNVRIYSDVVTHIAGESKLEIPFQGAPDSRVARFLASSVLALKNESDCGAPLPRPEPPPFAR